MKPGKFRTIIDGAVAGLIGGAVIALWFFVFDAAHGEPMRTPELLAAALLHGSSAATLSGAGWTLVAQYAVAHFAVFALIGVCGAMMLSAAEDNPELFPALFIFTCAFEVFFIFVLMLFGPAAQAATLWWKGLIGNFMATAAMLAFFFWRQPALAERLLGPWVAVVREGVVAGIIGGVIVAAWFFVYDLTIGEPFRTPALLGTMLLDVMHEPSGFAVTAASVLGYTALHFFAFIMFGIAASILMAVSEREPLIALGVLVLFIWFEMCFAGFVTFLDQTAIENIGWWNIIGGNILALAVIIGWYEHRHPRVVPRLFDRWEEFKHEGSAKTERSTMRPHVVPRRG